MVNLSTPVSDRAKLSHEAARDTVKHLITLATASIGILIALFKDLIGIETSAPVSLWLSILGFVASVLFGTLCLQCLTGNMEKRENPSVYDSNTRLFVGLQIFCFIGALAFAGFAVAYG